jgi:hypothetical protein
MIERFQREIQRIPSRILAEKFGTSRPTVDRWKAGRNVPARSILEAVLRRIDEMKAKRAFANYRKEKV